MNPNDEVKKENEIDWDKLLWHSLIAVASHPITQARVLIQLGHEPSAPFYRSKEGNMLPFLASSGWYHKGILTGYMRDANLFPATMETFSVGLAYKLIETTISSITQTIVTKPVNDAIETKEDDKSYTGVLSASAKEFCIKAAGCIAARPFYVCAVRQIASIAQGGDKSILSIIPLKQVLTDGGLFAGLVPKLCYEASVIFLSNSLVYLYITHGQSEDPDDHVKKLIPSVINMAVTTICYPLSLVSTIECVRGTGLVLDLFPELSWLSILLQLRGDKKHSRGNSMLFSRKLAKIDVPIEGTEV